MRIGWLCSLLVGAALLLSAGPAFAVVGEVSVTEAGEEVPGATVKLEFEDGSTAVAQEDEDEPGVYVFNVTEDKANQTGTLVITKGEQTYTEQVNLAGDGTPYQAPGGVQGYRIGRDITAPPGEQPMAPSWVGATPWVPQEPQISGFLRTGVRSSYRDETVFLRRESGGVVLGTEDGDNDSTSPTIGGIWRLDLGRPVFGLGQNAGAELRLDYFDTTSTEAFGTILPPAGGLLGVFAPVPGFGFTTGAAITDSIYTSEYTDFGGELRFFKAYSPYDGFLMESFAGFRSGWVDINQTYNGTTAGVDFFTATSLDNEYWGLVFGSEVSVDIPCNCNWTAFGGGFVDVNFNDVEASRSANLSTGLSGSDSFSEETTTVGGGGELGIRYRTGPVTLSLSGKVAVNNTIPVLNIDPQTGIPSADVDDALDASVNAQAIFVY